jgi:hypothetical protein
MPSSAPRRWLIFSLPYWAHLSTCLAIARQLTLLGHEVIFAFVYPPKRWVLDEIAAHGFHCEWSLKYARHALRSPGWAEQFRAVVAAEVDIIRSVQPDAVINDLHYTTSISGRAYGLPVVSIVRCVFSLDSAMPTGERIPEPRPTADEWNKLPWGDIQLIPHGRSWFKLRTTRSVYCTPCWVERSVASMTGAIAVKPSNSPPPAQVLGVLSTAAAWPLHRKNIQAAFEELRSDWLLCDPFSPVRRERVITWGDLSVLLPAARVLVCVGGHQLITRALSSAVPIVVLGTGQPHVEHYGGALEAAGAGVYVRTTDITAPAILDAVHRVLADSNYHSAAARLRRSFESEPDAASALIGELWG